MISFKHFLKEGGNAVKDAIRINQENVEATLKAVYKTLLPKLKIKPADTASLGSTGKKLPGGSSGDIDMAIDIGAIIKNNRDINTANDVFDAIVSMAKKSGVQYKDMRSMGLVSMAFPISNTDGKQDNAVVQLDFMPTDNVEYASWGYYSPAEWESQWKGLYRNEMLIAVARFMDYKTIATALDKEGIEHDVTWERTFWDMSSGLSRGRQTRLGKRGITKSAKTLDKWFITKDKYKVAKILFGPKYGPDDLLTWEDTFKAIMDKDFIHKSKRTEILKFAQKGLANKGIPVPDELDKAIS